MDDSLQNTINELKHAQERLISANNELKKAKLELENYSRHLEELVQERTSELATIYKIGQEISSILDLDEVSKIVVDRISDFLEIEICSLFLLDKNTGDLVIMASRGLTHDIISQTRIRPNEKISGWILQNKKAIIVEDIEKDVRFSSRNKERYYTHSFISAPLIVKNQAIGVINVNNKKNKEVFKQEDLDLLQEIAIQAAIAIENARLYTNTQELYMRAVMALTLAIDAKDLYTKAHSEHVTQYAVSIAKELNLEFSEIEQIKQACQLHDLGKIGVPDHILTKPGKLSPEEWEEMRLHPIKSADILRPLTFLDGVIDLVEQHHERYDGEGYPFNLKGEQIRLGARIMAVADAYDAMITERPYRKAMSKDEAVAELKKCSGTQFDPKTVEAFLRILGRQDL